MTPFQAVLKVTLRENFSLKRMLGASASKSKKMMWFVVLSIVYALGAFLFGMGYMFFQLGYALSQMGIIEMLLMFLFTYSTGIAVMFAMFRANGSLFHFRDFEILAPMPIKSWQIGIIKLLVMMINLYLSTLIVVSPILVSYFWYAESGFVNILFLIIGFFFIPLVPVALFSFLSLIIARVTAFFRKSNLLNILLMLALFMVVMYFSMSSAFSGDVNPFLGQIGFIEAMGNIYLPMKWFAEAAHNANVLSLALLALLSAAVFTGFAIILGAMMKKTNSVTMSTRTSHKARAVAYERNNVFNALITKEFRKFFNVPIYALNAGIGLVMLVVLGAASLFVKEEVTGFLAQMGIAGLPPALMLLAFQAFCLGTVYTSAISLSLEGKSFWVLKTMPIEPLTIMTAKMTFNVILGMSAVTLSTILFTIAFGFPVWTMGLMILAAASFSLVTSLFGSVINLRFPKFDFLSDTEVVKQSVGAIFGIFGGFGVGILDGFAYYGINRLLPFGWSLLLVVVLNSLIALGLWWLLRRATENLFKKLSA